jgi:hypothetical protein
MQPNCQTDPRRDAVRRLRGRNGLDYVEVDDDQRTLRVYFLGKLPQELSRNKPGIERFLRITGGESITGIEILDVDPHSDPDPEQDDFLVVRLSRAGDFSPYSLHLVDVEGIDPFYASVSFSFKVNCPSDLDCRPAHGCEPPPLEEPAINYLAKDYGSFRQLIFDRMALLMPEWRERQVPDIGVTLIELLAYAGDYLSYYQDAVATEAYLGTARQRISVRRHARLVDYVLHEGCNARTWVHLHVSQDLTLPADRIAFVTGDDPGTARLSVLQIEQLEGVTAGTYEYFEPLVADPSRALQLHEAHNEIRFYTWGRRECCIEKGATAATLLDMWVGVTPDGDADARHERAEYRGNSQNARPTRALKLQVGDVLIFEEVLGPRTGSSSDADPQRRWAVRLTRVEPDEDPVYQLEVGEGTRSGKRHDHDDRNDADHHDGGVRRKLPTPVVKIEWAREDALPFSLCLSAIGSAPNCAYLENVSVARANNVLVDHGRTLDAEEFGPVPGVETSPCCECEGAPSDIEERAAKFRPTLQHAPLTHREPLSGEAVPASQSLTQNLRAATPALSLLDDAGASWRVRQDLIGSGPDDRDVVVEIDNDGIAHLRFGDNELGRAPKVGSRFTAIYRVGLGIAGNIGADAISRLVLRGWSLDGADVNVRNPLPAIGGTEPEPIAEAKLLAPAAFRKRLLRAITAADYATLAQDDPRLQRAAAQLRWNGSWFEADVAIDPLDAETSAPALLDEIACRLHRYRRLGHDVRIKPARYVPILLSLEVCALPGYDRGDVKAALLTRFGNSRSADGTAGFFHPDELSFGEGVHVSRIIAAAQAVPGVECVTVKEFRRLFEPPNREIVEGLLPLAIDEIAQLDNDPNHPEHGQLQIVVRGGRTARGG